jgi:hypothetical protein
MVMKRRLKWFTCLNLIVGLGTALLVAFEATHHKRMELVSELRERISVVPSAHEQTAPVNAKSLASREWVNPHNGARHTLPVGWNFDPDHSDGPDGANPSFLKAFVGPSGAEVNLIYDSNRYDSIHSAAKQATEGLNPTVKETHRVGGRLVHVWQGVLPDAPDRSYRMSVFECRDRFCFTFSLWPARDQRSARAEIGRLEKALVQAME